MKFAIEYTDVLENKKLVYRKDEVSFETDPWLSYGSNFDIVINMLIFEVVGKDNRIAEIAGCCGINFSAEFALISPIPIAPPIFSLNCPL